MDPNPTTCVLLVNLGTPDKPSPFSVLKFLRQFLSDKRVIKIPKILWWLPLYFFILPFRSYRAATAYQKIWRAEGSPLKVLTESLSKQLENYLAEVLQKTIRVKYAMTYGNPNLKQQFALIEKEKYSRLIIVPLFPQYSSTTTGAVLDSLMRILCKRTRIPTFSFVDHYGLEGVYLEALAFTLQSFWDKNPHRGHLIFSFHGIPNAYANDGDPYPKICFEMAKVLAARLKIPENNWTIAFQSRLGRRAWTEPYLNDVLSQLLERGVKSVDVIAPSFAVDCLETLEELAIQTQENFLKAGGESFRYIPAMNDSEAHVMALAQIIKRFI